MNFFVITVPFSHLAAFEKAAKESIPGCELVKQRLIAGGKFSFTKKYRRPWLITVRWSGQLPGNALVDLGYNYGKYVDKLGLKNQSL